jgi:thiol:disulfide interchange protein
MFGFGREHHARARVASSTLENPVVQLPVSAHKLARNLGITLIDGLYLTSWPCIAAVAPLLALLAGILIGWWHPGFQTVFSESLGVMILAAILGMMSAYLGALLRVVPISRGQGAG